jgi:hypothetical protein
MSRYILSLLLALVSFTNVQGSILFDFESLPAGTHSSLSMTVGGLTATITRTSGNQFDIRALSGSYPVGWGTRAMENFSHGFPFNDAYNVNFSSAVDSTAIQFGDFAPSDSDGPVRFFAYSGLNGTGAVVGADAESWGGNDGFPRFGTLNVAGSGIRSIQFYGSGSVFWNSLFWDNLEVTQAQATIPEPGSLLVWGVLGLAGVGMTNRRRKS